MAFFYAENWEDVNEPLRKITHPETRTLLYLNVVAILIVTAVAFLLTPS